MRNRDTRNTYLLLVGLLLLIGIALRVYGAWCYRNSDNSDHGIVALMAKHMAEGRDFPTFFYGQGYMGSVEPAVSALFCFLFGYSVFSVCLGTAFVGMLLLPIVYAWGKDAGGKKAGIAALAYCVIGPAGYFHYMCSPRGGYAATLFFGTAVLWGASRIITQELNGRKSSSWWFLLLGIAAGLGWWSNQLTVSAFLTAGFLFLVVLKRKAFSWRLVPGIVGFFGGSLPFWIWNVRNNWRTFSFARSFGETDLLQGLYLFFVTRFLDLVDLQNVHIILQIVGTVVFAIVVFTSVLMLITHVRRQHVREYIHLLSAVVFILVSALLFSRSHFALFDTSRYLLPLVPAIAVLIGVATAQLADRTHYGIGWMPLILLLGWQVYTAPNLSAIDKNGYGIKHRAEVFADFLRRQDIDTVYCRYQHHWLNSALNEEFCFTTLPWERYEPYAQDAEIAGNIGVMRGCDNPEAFLRMSGGSAQKEKKAGFTIWYDFNPPPVDLSEILPERWTVASDSKGSNVMNVIADRNLDTYRRENIPEQEEDWLEIGFDPSLVVSAVRIESGHWRSPPSSIQIKGRTANDGPWQSLTSPLDSSFFYWSDIRPYWRGEYFRQEIHFPATRLSRLRICAKQGERDEVWHINELLIYGPSGQQYEPATHAIPNLLNVLEERRIEHLYCDRWIGNTVHKAMGSEILVEREPTLGKRNASEHPGVRFQAGTAFLVRREDAELCRQCLSKRNVVMRETKIKPWILFDFGPEQWKEEYADDHGLEWAGFGCFLANDKRWAGTLIKQAERAYNKEGSGPDAVSLMKQALRQYPNYRPAVDKLAAWLDQSGQNDEADKLKARSATMWSPGIPAGIRFQNGVEFLGLDLQSTVVEQGKNFRVRYYWLCPPEVRTRQLAVFVHFKRENILFQNDHVLLEDKDTSFQPYSDEVFVEERLITVPRNAGAGECEILLGLNDRRPPLKRLRPYTSLREDKKAIYLPATIRIAGD